MFRTFLRLLLINASIGLALELCSSDEILKSLWITLMRKEINTYSKISPNAYIKIQPFDINKRYTKPHRHNKYLELVYFSGGSGFHFMDEKEYAIEPPVVFIIKNDVVHHWQIDTVPQGYVLIVKEDFLDITLDKHINWQLQQLRNHQIIKTQLNPNIEALFEIACQELRLNDHVQDDVVEGVVKALFSKILGYANSADKHILKDMVVQFNELLESAPKNDVAYYAQLLNTTAQNLNVWCRKEYDKTASEVIAGHIVKESQRLLRYTELTVTEIAFKFDFKDVSHFVKYFKRHHGMTPKQYKTRIIP
ncbi:helix-turn-helix transcriptional regulator [Arenibacter sp. F26102]|uniref:helix-turn-helix domain-containing protein n=1 Tax=Arenibacter sp. F26102 TaxID=2926416 RepID=UPI001FF15ACB|nr:helix-turn-helix transcriptional regulator [Arenibacter sp. F26102]MCK0146185.1 helix-turn-helix transcriptional regulator [Arenibacter sp. F26102]